MNAYGGLREYERMRPTSSRRRWLRLCGALALTGAAGCAGDDDGGDGESGDGGDGDGFGDIVGGEDGDPADGDGTGTVENTAAPGRTGTEAKSGDGDGGGGDGVGDGGDEDAGVGKGEDGGSGEDGDTEDGRGDRGGDGEEGDSEEGDGSGEEGGDEEGDGARTDAAGEVVFSEVISWEPSYELTFEFTGRTSGSGIQRVHEGDYYYEVTADGEEFAVYRVGRDTYTIVDGQCLKSTRDPEDVAFDPDDEPGDDAADLPLTDTTTVDGESVYVFERDDLRWYVSAATGYPVRFESADAVGDFRAWGDVDPIEPPDRTCIEP